MIKALKKYQVQLTPFVATKNWALNNTDNSNVLLTEDADPDEYAVALQFIDYGDGSELPIENSLCNIALEQQGTDLATVEDGLYVTGPFYPNTDPQNMDGTYKRSIYYQVRTMFYNTYLNPTKIWGLENIDFELSKTKRLLTEQFKLFEIPRVVFGEKMTPNSITMTDNTLDNPYTITDDGNGNLNAGMNLFSHQQEVGKFTNEFVSSLSSSLCDWYWFNDTTANTDTSSLAVSFFGGAQENQLRTDSMSLAVGFLFGSNVDYPIFETSTLNLNFLSGTITQAVIELFITDSTIDTSSVTLAFDSGFNTDTTYEVTASFDSSSIELSFLTGSNLIDTYERTASFDSASVELSFVSGSNLTNAYERTASFESASLILAFLTGSNQNI